MIGAFCLYSTCVSVSSSSFDFKVCIYVCNRIERKQRHWPGPMRLSRMFLDSYMKGQIVGHSSDVLKRTNEAFAMIQGWRFVPFVYRWFTNIEKNRVQPASLRPCLLDRTKSTDQPIHPSVQSIHPWLPWIRWLLNFWLILMFIVIHPGIQEVGWSPSRNYFSIPIPSMDLVT